MSMALHFNLIVATEQYAGAAANLRQILETGAETGQARASLTSLLSHIQEAGTVLAQIEGSLSDGESGALTIENDSALGGSLNNILIICKRLISHINGRLKEHTAAAASSVALQSVALDPSHLSLILQNIQAQATTLQLLLTACSSESFEEVDHLLSSRQYLRLSELVSRNASSLLKNAEQPKRESTVKRKPVAVCVAPTVERSAASVHSISRSAELPVARPAVPEEAAVAASNSVGDSDSPIPISLPLQNERKEAGSKVDRSNSAAAPQRTYLEYRDEQGLLPTFPSAAASPDASRISISRKLSAAAPQRTFSEYDNEQGLLLVSPPVPTSSDASRSSLSGQSSTFEGDVLPWFKTGFQPLDLRNDSQSTQEDESRKDLAPAQRQENAARNAPQLYVTETDIRIDPQLDADRPGVEALLRRYGLESSVMATAKSEHVGKADDSGTLVRVKRVTDTDTQAAEGARREIAALGAIADVCTEGLVEWFQFESSIWIVLEQRPAVTLRQQVASKGRFPADVNNLKSIIYQLFAATASIFMAGFAHLRITDETVCIDRNSRIVLRDFQYAHEYGKDKLETMYAPVDAKHGTDIYVAPEVFASIRYNARKAVLWSCGVVIYFMTTGQTERLSSLGHPSFDSNSANAPRRHSVSSIKLVTYPSRLDVPSWARDIISKMLQTDPNKRAELIEVAGKVPKEVAMKETRPLMELAWSDYKTHVGPLAGLQHSTSSSASSIFSGVSNFSNPLGSLVRGRRKSSNKYTYA